MKNLNLEIRHIQLYPPRGFSDYKEILYEQYEQSKVYQLAGSCGHCCGGKCGGNCNCSNCGSNCSCGKCGNCSNCGSYSNDNKKF